MRRLEAGQSSLGLNASSISSYRLAELTRVVGQCTDSVPTELGTVVWLSGQRRSVVVYYTAAPGINVLWLPQSVCMWDTVLYVCYHGKSKRHERIFTKREFFGTNIYRFELIKYLDLWTAEVAK